MIIKWLDEGGNRMNALTIFNALNPHLVRKQKEELRIKKHKTQEEIAILSSTTRTYISRLENNRSDIEIGTLKKIVKAGFDKELKIQFI